MKQILCFGDSNTYGLIPKEGGRYPWGIRWTSILNEKLGLENYRVIEEGLCGRTTIFDDPLREGRCGIRMLPVVLETHNPIDIIVVMLGTIGIMDGDTVLVQVYEDQILPKKHNHIN